MLLDRIRLGVSVVVLGVFVAAAVKADTFFGIGRWFPLIVTVGGVVLSGVNLGFEIWRYTRVHRRRAANAANPDPDADAVPEIATPRPKLDTQGAVTSAEFVASARWFAIVLSCPVAMVLGGAAIGAGLWVALFMIFVVRRSRVFAAVSGAAVMGLLLLYANYFNLHLPQSVLFAWPIS
jgi:hypothetical protein